MYYIFEILYPGSFQGLAVHETTHQAVGDIYYKQYDLLYYSFTTLSTLGLGDIAPKHVLAKALTSVEAVYGQLFVATVVAKLVSVWKTAPNLE